MGGKTRISIAFLGAVAAVLAVTLVVPAFGASAPDTVELILDSENPRFEHNGVTQPIATARNGCQIDQFAGDGESLIDLSPSSENLRNLPLPGFSSDSIGIKSSGSNSNGTPCSQVDGPEPALDIGLGYSLSTQYAFEKVRLDLEMTGDAVVQLTFGGVVGSTSNPTTYLLQTGTSITVCGSSTTPACEDEAPDEPYYEVTSGPATAISACAAPNSSGPNSGGNDNCLWTVDPGFSFTTISLDVVDIGTVSLEGGSDTGMPSTFGIALLEGSVSGQKWRDHNNDGLRDTDFEEGIDGWTIVAYEMDPTTGAIAEDPAGEPIAAGSAVTQTVGDDVGDDVGVYKITNLPYGDYILCEFPPGGDPSYLTWYQSKPTDADGVCADIDGAEPDGWVVNVDGDETDKDFFNVRTLTLTGNQVNLDCDNLPPGGIIETGGEGEPLGSITIDPDNCKPGEYVFETYVLLGTDPNTGAPRIEQVADFYPLSLEGVDFYPNGPDQLPNTGDEPEVEKVPIIEDYAWVITDSQAQQVLNYDDLPPFDDGLQAMLFCNLPESALGTTDDLNDFLPEGETSCLLSTFEEIVELGAPGSGVYGVQRVDRVFTLIDGRRTLR